MHFRISLRCGWAPRAWLFSNVYAVEPHLRLCSIFRIFCLASLPDRRRRDPGDHHLARLAPGALLPLVTYRFVALLPVTGAPAGVAPDSGGRRLVGC
jgi:hypothetical protein